MADFNDIGISRELDLPRIEKLLKIGLFSAVLVFIADWLLGYVMPNQTADSFLAGFLSADADLSDSRIVTSAVLGMLGIMLEGLSYFGIYRLIVCKSPDMAHSYRTGIIGYIVFGGCGAHVSCCAIPWIYQRISGIDPAAAEKIALDFAKFFMMPASSLFFLFLIYLCIVQIRAFAKGMTPLPKWCWVFSLPVGMLCAQIPALFASAAWTNALSTAWISIGNLWMFGGLLVMVKKLRRASEGNKQEQGGAFK